MSFPTCNEEEFFSESFSGLDAKNETISFIKFQDCTFTRCFFSNVQFRGCSFLDCIFKNCDLSLIKVEDSSFRNVEFKDSKVIGVDWVSAAYPILINFENSLLNYSNFKKLNLKKIKIQNCQVIEANFTEANLTQANCQKSDFSGSRFLHTNLSQANFVGARNYAINIKVNKVEKARFSFPEVISLLNIFDVIIEDY